MKTSFFYMTGRLQKCCTGRKFRLMVWSEKIINAKSDNVQVKITVLYVLL